MNKRFILLLTALQLSFSIPAIGSYAFFVRPTGRLNEKIVFTFCDHAERPIEPNITSFVVSERTVDGRWQPVWVLRGKRKAVRQINYGQTCDGLNQVQAAKKLVAGKVYGVFVFDAGGGSAGRNFKFLSDGLMIYPETAD
jgi:hypothetical protein